MIIWLYLLNQSIESLEDFCSEITLGSNFGDAIKEFEKQNLGDKFGGYEKESGVVFFTNRTGLFGEYACYLEYKDEKVKNRRFQQRLN